MMGGFLISVRKIMVGSVCEEIVSMQCNTFRKNPRIEVNNVIGPIIVLLTQCLEIVKVEPRSDDIEFSSG